MNDKSKDIGAIATDTATLQFRQVEDQGDVWFREIIEAVTTPRDRHIALTVLDRDNFLLRYHQPTNAKLAPAVHSDHWYGKTAHYVRADDSMLLLCDSTGWNMITRVTASVSTPNNMIVTHMREYQGKRDITECFVEFLHQVRDRGIRPGVPMSDYYQRMMMSHGMRQVLNHIQGVSHQFTAEEFLDIAHRTVCAVYGNFHGGAVNTIKHAL